MKSLFSNFTKAFTIESTGKFFGVVIGGLLVLTAGTLITALIVQWILSFCGIYTATYAQVVGALTIWYIVKPASK